MSPLVDGMREIFHQVQFNRRCHAQYLSKMKKLFEKANEKEFFKGFIMCLAPALSIGEKQPKVENTFEFAAKFAVTVYSIDNVDEKEDAEDQEQGLCLFWNSLFDFLLENHDVEDVAIRFRMCYFLNMLLNSMGDNAFIDDALCDRITNCMMERLQDRVPKIRAQAILSLHRLQDPADDDCQVIKAFIFHLSKDPQAEVRRAVLLTLGKNKQTLAAVLRRTRDTNEGVRKLAYQFLSKITVRSLKIEQRDRLLSDGLRDRCEKVSEFVKTHLLPTWLEHYEGQFVSLLRALDAERTLKTSFLMLETLFKSTPLRNIIEQVPVDEDTKLIPIDQLSSENVIYWRCTLEHLYREGCEDQVEKVAADLSKFCEYIREFIKYMKRGSREPWEIKTLQFVLLQLFEITKTYDLGDEVGRNNLKELILDLLKSDIDSEVLIDCIVQQLVGVVPNTETRLQLLADVISEIRMPLTTESQPISEEEKHEREMKRAKLRVQLLQLEEEQHEAVKGKDFLQADVLNKKLLVLYNVIKELDTEPVLEELAEPVMKDDEETLVKSLQIMFSMMQSVKTFYPTLRSLFEDMVLPSLDHAADRVIVLAIKTTSVCCLMDKNLAKKYLPVFFLQFGIENNEIWLASIKGIFDLLVHYGLEHLGMTNTTETEEAESQANKSRRHKTVRLFSNSDSDDLPTGVPRLSLDNSNKNIIGILTGLLDNVNQDLRTIAAEGLCKLLLHRRISSAPLLARLIILWHNPVTTDDAYLRQCLSYFFNHFPALIPGSQEMLGRSFLPTLKILANAPGTSPLQDIEPVKVAQLILHLTKIGAQNRPLAYSAHNNLALAIIAEALNNDSVIDPGVLIKSLKYLDLNLEEESTKKCLQEAVEKLLAQVEPSDKRSLNSVLQFKKTLYIQESEEEEEEEAGVEDEQMMEDDPMIEEESEVPEIME